LLSEISTLKKTVCTLELSKQQLENEHRFELEAKDMDHLHKMDEAQAENSSI